MLGKQHPELCPPQFTSLPIGVPGLVVIGVQSSCEWTEAPAGKVIRA